MFYKCFIYVPPQVQTITKDLKPFWSIPFTAKNYIRKVLYCVFQDNSLMTLRKCDLSPALPCKNGCLIYTFMSRLVE